MEKEAHPVTSMAVAQQEWLHFYGRTIPCTSRPMTTQEISCSEDIDYEP